MAKKKPVHHIPQRGSVNGVKIAIWENGSGDRPKHYFTIERSYKDDDGEWQNSDIYWRNDGPVVSKLVDLAFAWMCEQEVAARSEETSQ